MSQEKKHKKYLLYAKIERSSEIPELVKWIIKVGIARNTTQANIAIASFIAIMVILTSAVFKYGGPVNRNLASPGNVRAVYGNNDNYSPVFESNVFPR